MMHHRLSAEFIGVAYTAVGEDGFPLSGAVTDEKELGDWASRLLCKHSIQKVLKYWWGPLHVTLGTGWWAIAGLSDFGDIVSATFASKTGEVRPLFPHQVRGRVCCVVGALPKPPEDDDEGEEEVLDNGEEEAEEKWDDDEVSLILHYRCGTLRVPLESLYFALEVVGGFMGSHKEE
jgi:hypothetical protein